MRVKECSREKILNIAKEIAADQGVQAIDIRTVAKRCGISIGTVYNYYPSKGDLLTDVIVDFWGVALKKINPAQMEALGFLDALEQLYYGLLDYLHQFKENWIDQISLLRKEERALGRQKEHTYFEHLYAAIAEALREDTPAREHYDEVGLTHLSDFIFRNILAMLKDNETDFTFFKTVLQKIL